MSLGRIGMMSDPERQREFYIGSTFLLTPGNPATHGKSLVVLRAH